MTITGESIELKRAGSECFKLLASCFYQPEKDALREAGTLESLSGLLGRVCPEAARFAEKMSDALDKYDNEELLVEYAKLFVGPFELMAAPYGSVYLDEGRRTMGDSTIAVTGIYKEEGLTLDDTFKELPDHIAAELEFMYYLSYQEIEALEKNDEEKAAHFLNRQRYFIRTFLGRWVPPFCEKIKLGTKNEFYRALADCLSVFISRTNPVNSVSEGLNSDAVRA